MIQKYKVKLELKDKRIIFCRLGGIGDVIHTLPLVKYIRNKYPSAIIEYTTSNNIKELLDNCCPFIDKVWVFEKGKEKQLAKEILNFTSQKLIEYFFNLHGSLRFFLWHLTALRARKYFHYKKNNSNHAIVNFARTYDESISVFALDSQVLYVNSSNNIFEENKLRKGKYVCFVPGVGSVRPHRAWPFENWISLTKKFLTHEKGFKVVFLGGEYEGEIFDSRIKTEEGVVNLIGKLNLFEVSQIISTSAILVSCDTGLLHIANGLGVKTVGLYGPTLPDRSGPFSVDSKVFRAKNCFCLNNIFDTKSCKKTKDRSGYCMDSLIPDEILSELCTGKGTRPSGAIPTAHFLA